MAPDSYHQPVSLIVLSSISIGVAALAALWILVDIVHRRGWKSMMLIMIPVYTINALYIWPITVWVYLKYGRPAQPRHERSASDSSTLNESLTPQPSRTGRSPSDETREMKKEESANDDTDHGEGCHHSSERPLFATVTIAVCHCGAACVLGDIVGEWLVYGTDARIGSPGRLLWTEFLVDAGFAFVFGILFQYFSIAPMASKYGVEIIIRAVKADFMSLLFFQLGLFGWMAAYQIGIFNWRLETNTVTYWWMMQIGMFIGHWTGVPINWWLIKKGIKEPCA